VGIIIFFEYQCPPDVKSKPRLTDAIAVDEIKHRTDRPERFAGQMMKLCNVPCCHICTGNMFPEQVGTDKVGASVSSRRICAHMSHFSGSFSLFLMYIWFFW
jgi:hypothetical protein